METPSTSADEAATAATAATHEAATEKTEQTDESPEEEVDISVSGVGTSTALSSRLRKHDSKRKFSVSFNEEADTQELFEIEDGNNFRRTPSQAKQKAQAGRWSNPMSLSTGRKRLRVDIMDDIVQEEPKKEPEPEEAATAPPPPVSKPRLDVSSLTDQEVEAKFMACAVQSFNKIDASGGLLKVNNMVPDLKASGLFDRIKAKHGAVRKWFTSHPGTWGLSSENFISLRTHNEELLKRVRKTLEDAPKGMLRMHQLVTALKAQLSENGFKRQLRGYPSIEIYIAAHPNHFMVSKKGGFVTNKKQDK